MSTPYGPSPEDKKQRRRRIETSISDKEDTPVQPEGRIIHSETGIQYNRPHLVPKEFYLIILTSLGCVAIIYILLRGNLTGEARSRFLEVERNVHHFVVHKLLGRPSTPPSHPAPSPVRPASQSTKEL